MKRIAHSILAAFASCLAACVGGPYNAQPKNFSLRPDASPQAALVEEPAEMGFAYGKYCGGPWPRFAAKKEQTRERMDTLQALWPPVDDLDALCYAHDYCFELQGVDNVRCDSAFRAVLINTQNSYSATGCWNLSTDMIIAFFGKSWGAGTDDSETFATRFVSITFGIPVAAFWATLKVPTRLWATWPPNPAVDHALAGVCNFKEAPDPGAVIVEFEKTFKRTLESFGAKIDQRIEYPGRPPSPTEAESAT